MARRPKRAGGTLADRNMYSQSLANHQLRQDAASPDGRGFAGAVELELERVVGFLGDVCVEIDTSIDPTTRNPHLNMLLHLLKGHLEGRLVSASSMAAASGVPYATAMRKLGELQTPDFIEQRPRTKSGRSFSLHPSATCWNGSANLPVASAGSRGRPSTTTAPPGTTSTAIPMYRVRP
jgi:hypothetical protein